MENIIKLIPILIATLAMIIVSFMKIKKQNKKLAIIVTFMLWLAIAGITWMTIK